MQHGIHPGGRRIARGLHLPGSLPHSQHVPYLEGTGFVTESPSHRIIHGLRRVRHFRQQARRILQALEGKCPHQFSRAVLFSQHDFKPFAERLGVFGLAN